MQKKNTVLLRKYNGDAKFARVHKRIREENLARKAANKQPIVSEYDMSIMNVLLSIKSDIDQKVYDRNDILKKDAYFERTVMTQIKAGIDKLGIASAREDRVFIQSRITKQYLDQYNQTYSVVFYNYILKCFVLIDLKTEKITHQDVGQMDMYIRMYDELKRSEGDNPTIGIVLCSDTDDDIARYSVMHGNEQLFASKYKLYLPTKEELKAEIETQKAMFYLQQQDNEDRNKNYTFNIE